MVKILYFGRFREKVGIDGEELVVPAGLTARDLLALLAGRGGAWQELFGSGEGVLVAVNQVMAGHDSVVADGDELAVFPPVTGG